MTSDNVSPLHLMDIKRVAFEVRPVKSTRPAVAASVVSSAKAPASQPVMTSTAAPAAKIGREEIAAIVDRFLAGRREEEPGAPATAEAEAGSMYAGTKSTPLPAPATSSPASNGRSDSEKPASASAPTTSANGRKAIDFVSEDDVRRAIQKGEKIYVNARTIITPAARDLGEPAEVFAKVT